tara:strand:+ start:550 stop:741 length:192 start_codon:yes stop_codon:yes gene_type:complete
VIKAKYHTINDLISKEILTTAFSEFDCYAVEYAKIIILFDQNDKLYTCIVIIFDHLPLFFSVV